VEGGGERVEGVEGGGGRWKEVERGWRGRGRCREVKGGWKEGGDAEEIGASVLPSRDRFIFSKNLRTRQFF
jgi:hypothetical protein